MQSFIDRFRASAGRARLVQSRIKALQRMAQHDISLPGKQKQKKQKKSASDV
jgi:ATPase subunit of ABC transporter with duplicated ATPase domains